MLAADMVLLNGKVCTVDKHFSFCQAVAIKDGWIIDLGADADIKPYIGRHTEVIDLQGRLALPGIQDGHTHAAFGGLYWRKDFVDIDKMTEPTQILEAIQAAVAKSRPGSWILAGGLHRPMHQGRLLDCWHLDSVAPNNPLLIFDNGLHRLLLNSKAKELCGLTRDTPDPDIASGRIERNSYGEPTGAVVEFAILSDCGRYAYMCNRQELEDCVLRTQQVLNSYGVTSYSDIVGPGGNTLFCGTAGNQALEAYMRLAQAGKLTARCSINVLAGLNGVQSYEAIINGLDNLCLPETNNQWLQAKAVKIFGDFGWRRPQEARPGCLGNCTFPGNTGEEQIEHLTRTVVELHRRGWQMGIHVTGGRGIDAVISAFVAAQRQYPGKNLRHFLIHGDELNEKNIHDCARNHILLQAQAVAPYCFMEKVVDELITPQAEAMFDYAGYQRAGMIVAQGSDAPTMPANWLLGVQFMLTRTCKMGQIFRADLRCGLEDAIRMYTINGAYQNHMEHICGSIEVDKLADFVVLADDIFQLPPEQVGQVPVDLTICNGKVVYQS